VFEPFNQSESTAMTKIITLLLSFLLAGFSLIPVSSYAQITWDGGGDGTSWDNPFNWDPDIVPGASEDVFITTGTPTLNVTATVNTLVMTNGTLGGTETLTISGLFTWSSGTISGSSTINANGGISFSSVST